MFAAVSSRPKNPRKSGRFAFPLSSAVRYRLP
jgi:hypothetical protein